MIPALFALWAAVSGEWGQGGIRTPHPSLRIWASLGRLWKELRQPARIPFSRVSRSEKMPGSLGFHFQLALSKIALQ